jgi:hypothetical protein
VSAEPTAYEELQEAIGDARWLVVSPIPLTHKQARLVVCHAYNVFPASDEVAVLERPELSADKVHVIDRAALEPFPGPALSDWPDRL